MIAECLLLLAVFLFAIAFYKWATINNDYFKQRNLKYVKPTFLLGNIGVLLRNKFTAPELAQKTYREFPYERLYGNFMFRTPHYVIRCPETIKQFAVKDFDHFENHSTFGDEKINKLWGNSLFMMQGEKWREMRATLSPAFTGSKMRQMFELVVDCVEDVKAHFLKRVENGERINVEMKDFFSRFTSDIIATCAYGLKINSFVEPENEFYVNGRQLTDFTSFMKFVKSMIISLAPKLARILDIQFNDPKVEKIFSDTILETMDVRVKNNIFRPDMINIMMQVRAGTLEHQADEKKESEGFATVEESEVGKVIVKRDWNDDQIVAQCFIFFVGGFETTSSMLVFASYELAAHPDIQEKLHREIVQTNEQLSGKRITYDALQKMKYLDQVICELLRKWPPLLMVDRMCNKDYTFDNNDDLKFNVEKGIPIFFPVYGLHHDEKYFPEPDKFDPERFSDENRQNIIPGTYIPFGVGPRNCIGSRFAIMELKAILYGLLLKFSFEPNEKSVIPIKLKKSPFNMSPENGLHIELKPRI